MSDARYVIQAAGVGYRWHDHLGVRKHKIVIDGEPIIDRTVRQLRERGCDDIVIIAPDDDGYRLPGTTWHLPDGYGDVDNQVSAFLLTRPLWPTDKATVLLYGDIYWTDEAISSVIGYDGPDTWHVWYRPGGSEITLRRHGEVWAHWFSAQATEREEIACRRVVDLYRSEALSWKNTCGWTIYRAMLGMSDVDIDGYSTPDHDHATVIDDWTEDFDSPLDYVRWYGRWTAHRYPVRVVFNGTPAETQAVWQVPNDPTVEPMVIVTVNGDLQIGAEQFWCGATHAVEHNVTVIPYSHVYAGPPPPWEPMWTAHEHDKRIVIHPADVPPDLDNAVRLYGRCMEGVNV